MSERIEIRLSGSGGQGLSLAGKILAEAAAIHAGLYATQSQSYGPEARGGVSRSEVILSEEPIDYPRAQAVDVLLALTQESYDLYTSDLKHEGIAVVDECVRPRGDEPFRVVRAPVLRIAREELGKPVVGNIVALGLMVGVSGILPVEALRAAVLARAPKGTEELNLRALERGLEEAKPWVQ